MSARGSGAGEGGRVVGATADRPAVPFGGGGSSSAGDAADFCRPSVRRPWPQFRYVGADPTGGAAGVYRARVPVGGARRRVGNFDHPLRAAVAVDVVMLALGEAAPNHARVKAEIAARVPPERRVLPDSLVDAPAGSSWDEIQAWARGYARTLVSDDVVAALKASDAVGDEGAAPRAEGGGGGGGSGAGAGAGCGPGASAASRPAVARAPNPPREPPAEGVAAPSRAVALSPLRVTPSAAAVPASAASSEPPSATDNRHDDGGRSEDARGEDAGGGGAGASARAVSEADAASESDDSLEAESDAGDEDSGADAGGGGRPDPAWSPSSAAARRKRRRAGARLRSGASVVVRQSESKFDGVHWHVRDERWVARWRTRGGHDVHIGYFKAELQAAIAVDLFSRATDSDAMPDRVLIDREVAARGLSLEAFERAVASTPAPAGSLKMKALWARELARTGVADDADDESDDDEQRSDGDGDGDGDGALSDQVVQLLCALCESIEEEGDEEAARRRLLAVGRLAQRSAAAAGMVVVLGFDHSLESATTSASAKVRALAREVVDAVRAAAPEPDEGDDS